MNDKNTKFGETPDTSALLDDIKRWSKELGFDEMGITSTDLGEHEARLLDWLKAGKHGEMDYMARNVAKRCRPQMLHPGTISIIVVRMNYLPEGGMQHAMDLLEQPDKACIARYAVGRDYHKMMRKRLQKLADRIAEVVGPFGHRAFTDSAPVLEKALAERAGLGWIGKHTVALNRNVGSWFFIGELFTDLPLPPSQPAENHCGQCSRCIDICPTKAITAPYSLDARRCIAYLTIEHKSAIPVEFRHDIGNRIFGCDDCQLVCPWNRFAQVSAQPDFRPLKGLDGANLCDLFLWSEEHFLKTFEGSAIRRLGHIRWLRNIAVALGNAPYHQKTMAVLRARADHESELVREHVAWGIAEQEKKRNLLQTTENSSKE